MASGGSGEGRSSSQGARATASPTIGYRGPCAAIGARQLRMRGPTVHSTALCVAMLRCGAERLGARWLDRRPWWETATAIREGACCRRDCVAVREKENPKWVADQQAIFRQLDQRTFEDHEGLGSGRRHSDELFDAARAFLHDHVKVRGLCAASGAKVVGLNLAYKRTTRNGVEGVSIMDPYRTRGVGCFEHMAPETVPDHLCCKRPIPCLRRINAAGVKARRTAYAAAGSQAARRREVMPLVSPHLGGYCNNAVRIILGSYVSSTVLADMRRIALQGELRKERDEKHGMCSHRQQVDPPNKNVVLRQSFDNYMQVTSVPKADQGCRTVRTKGTDNISGRNSLLRAFMKVVGNSKLPPSTLRNYLREFLATEGVKHLVFSKATHNACPTCKALGMLLSEAEEDVQTSEAAVRHARKHAVPATASTTGPAAPVGSPVDSLPHDQPPPLTRVADRLSGLEDLEAAESVARLNLASVVAEVAAHDADDKNQRRLLAWLLVPA
eukprot:CAMPEP_0118957812 /NCGR_PEP_ID=MMETSP1169-20130426/62300_1 /TAXON_ID=36882 /ORGANISM="Pyramimonas obovata, Strain CCMP722" /LENGTH=498 /DNA_ID=CAMNT_0006905913 /DNA_START=2665 /DNA_END=4158 /DNA_ORIENTATION=+